MNKAVLISIQPKWCELIASGKKTVEVRKSRPKLNTPFKCYIYATKPKSFVRGYPNDVLFRHSNGRIECGFSYSLVAEKGAKTMDYFLSGKVIGEFVCDEITTLNYDTEWGVEPPQEGYFCAETPSEHVLLDFDHCLTNKELIDYGKGKLLYGWHISDLKIYDKPKELWEFKKAIDCEEGEHCLSCTNRFLVGNGGCRLKAFTRPPQSWCYVEEIKNNAV